MSFIVPKKPQILYAPMLSSFGGGSARAFSSSVEFPRGPFDYSFESSTFGNGGTEGRNAPGNSTYTNNITGSSIPSGKISISSGIITWTPPGSATYRITVRGARGKNPNGTYAGYGATMIGNFELTNSTQLKMLIGQPGTEGNGGAGGGMTAVAFTNNTALIVAGGGGGGGNDNSTNVPTGESNNARLTETGTGVGSYNSGGGATYLVSGGCGASGGGGAGFSVNGQQTSGSAASATSFTNGGVGGITQRSEDGLCVTLAYGGFGGGGGGGNTGPGGGGWKGGDGTAYESGTYYGGNGGSSYNNGTDPDNSVGTHTYGSITIQALGG